MPVSLMGRTRHAQAGQRADHEDRFFCLHVPDPQVRLSPQASRLLTAKLSSPGFNSSTRASLPPPRRPHVRLNVRPRSSRPEHRKGAHQDARFPRKDDMTTTSKTLQP